ncbi:hypothetical protein [Dongshaea marina]|uniref:hypothetical protein n=1 Tax=Dongshaea marina TaxID=2047966 RepID=UPI00131EE237|nr:hypothetical protein [Dongshaea marina]
MNPFSIAISQISGIPMTGDVIGSETFEKMQQAEYLMQQARIEASQIIEQAQEQLAQARQEIALMQEQAHLQATNHARELAESAQSQAIADAIQWLVDEQSLERAIACEMEQKVRSLVAFAIREFAGEQDTTELLIRRISKMVDEQLKHNRVSLIVNPNQLKYIRKELGEGDELVYRTDEGLSESQAVIETSLVRMELDLDRHLELIIEHLLGESKAVACG